MSVVQKSLVGVASVAIGLFVFKEGTSVMAQVESKPSTALVCTLTEPELQARRNGIIKNLRESAQEVRELDTGWSFRYSGDRVDDLVEFIKLERRCCNFFGFSLRFEPENGPIWLSITGPAGTKSIIAAEMKPVVRQVPSIAK